MIQVRAAPLSVENATDILAEKVAATTITVPGTTKVTVNGERDNGVPIERMLTHVLSPSIVAAGILDFARRDVRHMVVSINPHGDSGHYVAWIEFATLLTKTIRNLGRSHRYLFPAHGEDYNIFNNCRSMYFKKETVERALFGSARCVVLAVGPKATKEAVELLRASSPDPWTCGLIMLGDEEALAKVPVPNTFEVAVGPVAINARAFSTLASVSAGKQAVQQRA